MLLIILGWIMKYKHVQLHPTQPSGQLGRVNEFAIPADPYLKDDPTNPNPIVGVSAIHPLCSFV